MIIERRLIPPQLGVHMNAAGHISAVIGPHDVTPALKESVQTLFHAGAARFVGRSFDESAPEMLDFLRSVFLTAMMTGQYVRNPATGLWDVTLN